MPTHVSPFILVVYEDDSIEIFNELETIPIDIKATIETLLLKWTLEILTNEK